MAVALIGQATDANATSSFKLVTKTDDPIISQLMKGAGCEDKVHPVIDGSDGFIHDRVGTISETHQTWVMTEGEGADVRVQAALYTSRFEQPIASPVDLCGNVLNILRPKVAFAGANPPESLIFYSISSFTKGGGEALIGWVYNLMLEQFPNIKLSTLSPMRGAGRAPAEERNFTDWLRSNVGGNVDDLRGDKERLEQLAFQYLSQGVNKVQGFHLQNGAYIGDINVNANKVGSADHRDGMNLMVNYIYPSPDKRKACTDLFADGQMAISSHLIERANRSTNRRVFRRFPS